MSITTFCIILIVGPILAYAAFCWWLWRYGK